MTLIPKIPYTKARSVLNPETSDCLPINEWVIINSNKNIGIVYAFKKEDKIIVESCRIYSRDKVEYSYEKFDEWRQRIQRIEGQ